MHIHLCPSGFLKGEMLVEETLVSSWIDLNFSIGLHVARAVSLQDLLENYYSWKLVQGGVGLNSHEHCNCKQT